MTFDATEGGGSVTGTFNAPTCPVAVSIDPTTCLPTGLPVVNTCG